jgi:hypothetical protein
MTRAQPAAEAARPKMDRKVYEKELKASLAGRRFIEARY